MRDGTPVAHRAGDVNAEPELRAYLLAEAVEFRRNHVEILLDPGHDWAKTAWEQLSGPVDQLANGQAYSFHGYQLPDAHPMRAAYLNADLVLDARDVLRLAE
jgi:hypothetical protein